MGKPSSMKDAQAPTRIWESWPLPFRGAEQGCPSAGSGLMKDICAPVSSQ